jgi:8-oxo-dGTP diphosphatase
MTTGNKPGDLKTDRLDEPVPVTAAIIELEGRYLVGRRSAGRFVGKWEFPGGKLEKGETPEEGLKRELREELGVETTIGSLFQEVVWPYDHMTVRLFFYRATILSGEPRAIDHSELRWVLPQDLVEYDFPDADRPVLERLLKDLRGRS